MGSMGFIMSDLSIIPKTLITKFGATWAMLTLSQIIINTIVTLQLIYNFRFKETDKIFYSIGICNHYFVSKYSYYVNRGPQSYYSSGSIANNFFTGKVGINFLFTKYVLGGISLVYIPKTDSTRDFTEHSNIDNTQSDTVIDYINPKRFWLGFKLGYKF